MILSTILVVENLVTSLLRANKQELFDRAGSGRLQQSGAVAISTGFNLTPIDPTVPLTMPSIEMFVAGADGTITPTGPNEALNSAWEPAVRKLCRIVFDWLQTAGVTLAGDAYVTASITPAADVSGDPHFDDDQFVAEAGTGIAVVVADRAGSRVASAPIPHDDISAPHPLVVDDSNAAAFALGDLTQQTFDAGDVIAFPQFGQLHAGPGPVGSDDEVRHLLVLRAATMPVST